jgi:hypothetical protein
MMCVIDRFCSEFVLGQREVRELQAPYPPVKDTARKTGDYPGMNILGYRNKIC